MYLIIGASSFIGSHLFMLCKKEGIDVLGTYYTHTYNDEWVPFDLCIDELPLLCEKNLNGKMPDAIVICSANTSIDSCKRDEKASDRLNVTSMKKLLDQADAMGIKTVFLSSEAVFDGKRGLYTESDIPKPVTLYGRQKLQIEQYIMDHISNYLIFRISRAVGSCYQEKDIFYEFYHKIMNLEEIVCLKNQYFCLTEVDDIAKGMIGAIEKGLRGLFHLSSANYISRYELAKLYAEKIFGGYDNIVEKDYRELPFADGRHLYAGLNGEKLAAQLNLEYMDLDTILEKYRISYQATNT